MDFFSFWGAVGEWGYDHLTLLYIAGFGIAALVFGWSIMRAQSAPGGLQSISSTQQSFLYLRIIILLGVVLISAYYYLQDRTALSSIETQLQEDAPQ